MWKNATNDRISQLDKHIADIEKRITAESIGANKQSFEYYRWLALSLKDIYQMLGVAFTGIVACRGWISAVHKRTLGDIPIRADDETESLLQRFDTVFGQLETRLKNINTQFEENKESSIYG